MKTIILYYNIVDKQDFSYFQKKLEGYKFPVYTTAFCPRNETEWKIRSSFLNCTTKNGYTCLPNKNLTELLEFCFKRPFIWIQEGINQEIVQFVPYIYLNIFFVVLVKLLIFIYKYNLLCLKVEIGFSLIFDIFILFVTLPITNITDLYNIHLQIGHRRKPNVDNFKY